MHFKNTARMTNLKTILTDKTPALPQCQSLPAPAWFACSYWPVRQPITVMDQWECERAKLSHKLWPYPEVSEYAHFKLQSVQNTVHLFFLLGSLQNEHTGFIISSIHFLLFFWALTLYFSGWHMKTASDPVQASRPRSSFGACLF